MRRFVTFSTPGLMLASGTMNTFPVSPPIELGRMEPTASDPAGQQQRGMTVGMPDAGQVMHSA